MRFIKVGNSKEFHTIDGVKDRMDCKKNTWLVGVIFAEKIEGKDLQWKWNPKQEYAECYNLAETESEIKVEHNDQIEIIFQSIWTPMID